MKTKGLILFLLIIGLQAHSQTITDFTLKEVSSGQTISLTDFSTKKGIVVLFISNVCPYAVYYEGRITQLIADFESKGIQFLLVNSHTDGKESESEMANKKAAWGLEVPYLSDKDQQVMQAFGARKAPEVFILKPNGSSFSIFYKGAIDNNPQVASDVKNSYLRDNLNSLLLGKPAIAGGRPIGCIIK